MPLFDVLSSLFTHSSPAQLGFGAQAQASGQINTNQAVKNAILATGDALQTAVAPFTPDMKYKGTFIGQVNGRMTAFDAATTDISAVPPILPQNNPHPQKTILFLNGINTTAADAFSQCQQIANQTGQAVINVHVATLNMLPNVTAFDVHPLGTLTGDGVRALEAHAGWGQDPAAVPLSRAIIENLDRKQEVDIIAHSMGGLVLAEGVKLAEIILGQRGLNPQQVHDAMQLVHVQTIGSASNNDVDGPQYINNVISDGDPLAQKMGLGSAGAHVSGPVTTIASATNNPLMQIPDNHLFAHYLPSIKPF